LYVRQSLADCVSREFGIGSSTNLSAGFDEILYVGSSLIGLGNCPSACRGIRGNPIVDFWSGIETLCMGLIVEVSVLGVPLSQDTNAEPIECMELMAIAAVEVGSNIHRKLRDDLETR
jgi:hypothetical protein